MTLALHSRGRRIAVVALAVALVLAMTSVAVIAFIGMVALRAAKPQDGEWSTRVGPWQHEVSVPVLLRWATHPLALPLLDGRRVRTRTGTWQLAARGNGSMHATCEPCVLRLAELGPAPLVLRRVAVHARRAGIEAWAGTVELATDTSPNAAGTRATSTRAAEGVLIAWSAKLQRDGIAWQARLEPTPVVDLLATLADGAVPEARLARVDGTFGFDASALVNQHGSTQPRVRPRIEGLAVEGLGTKLLATASPPTRCGPTRARIDGWLPRAVVAAEDQRFFEHAGFDLGEALHAWTRNGRNGHNTATTPRGASTITQQLAKLVYTGDDRSAARKLREWLYAVEMERTLGKGRILQLYLALAPWGAEVCGGEGASRRYLGKAANRLAPHEAAWLASLLRQPDALLARYRNPDVDATVDIDRVAHVIEALRPMPTWQREQSIDALQRWWPAGCRAGCAGLRHQ